MLPGGPAVPGPDDALDSGIHTWGMCTDAVQPISNGLYARRGMVPRIPIWRLFGEVRRWPALPPLPAGLESVAFESVAATEPDGERRLQAILDDLDRAVIGSAHPADHGFLRRDGRVGFLVRDRGDGAPLGYVYGSGIGRMGPLLALDPALHPTLVGVAVRETPALGPSRCGCPGPRTSRRARCSTPACGWTGSRASCAGRAPTTRSTATCRSRWPSSDRPSPDPRRRRRRRGTGGDRGAEPPGNVAPSTPAPESTRPARARSPVDRPSRRRTVPSLFDRLTGRGRPARPDHAVVVLHDVTKRYPNGNEALKDVDLVVPEGDFVFLVGPSGAGKSTLMKLLIRDELATHGDVVIDGFDLARIRRRQVPKIRRKIGIVFQDFKLLPRKTVYENVAFALEVTGTPRRQIRPAVERVIALVGLTGQTKQLPDQLSGGEQQRTAIARALVHDPRIIIADEPTGNLDPVISWEIIQLLLRINELGVTVLMATHNAEVVTALRKRVVALEDGRIIRDETGAAYHRED